MLFSAHDVVKIAQGMYLDHRSKLRGDMLTLIRLSWVCGPAYVDQPEQKF